MPQDFFRTPLCDPSGLSPFAPLRAGPLGRSLLAIRYPILQARMARAAMAELAASVGEAGGPGVLAAVTKSGEELLPEINAVRGWIDVHRLGCGQGAGWLHEVKSAARIVEELVREAAGIWARRALWLGTGAPG